MIDEPITDLCHADARGLEFRKCQQDFGVTDAS